MGSDSTPTGTASNVAEYSVSEISGALKRTVEDTFSHVRVRGEISGYRGPHSSGHAYFALKMIARGLKRSSGAVPWDVCAFVLKREWRSLPLAN